MQNHRRFWYGVSQSIAGSILFTIGAVLVGYAREEPMKWLSGFHLTILLVGIYTLAVGGYITLRWLLDRKPAHGNPKSLGFRLLREECNLLLRVYRDLLATDPEHVKRPLDHNSWPLLTGNNPWTYTQLTLFHLRRRFEWLMANALLAFREMGWTEYSNFLGEEPEFMTSLLPHLEKFERILDAKIDALNTRR